MKNAIRLQDTKIANFAIKALLIQQRETQVPCVQKNVHH